MADYLELDEWNPRRDHIAKAADRLRRGELVCCPTDTTMGVMAALGQSDAVTRLSKLRRAMAGSPEALNALKDKPPAVIFPDIQTLGEYTVLSKTAFTLVKRLLPGPYTIILPASRLVPKKMQSRRRHLGARFPDHAVIEALLGDLGTPVVSITAKYSDGRLIGDAIDAKEHWGHLIDLVVDTGPFFPEPSTVISFEGDVVELVREGKGSIDML